nr:MAG TPA: AAA domain protein [Caudoviricetes sp.]
MKDINQYRYITHKNQNTMIRVIIENPKTGKSYICKSYSK